MSMILVNRNHFYVTVIGPWSTWSECSVTCGNGTQFRNRSCIKGYEDGTVEYKECYMGCCPGMYVHYKLLTT